MRNLVKNKMRALVLKALVGAMIFLITPAQAGERDPALAGFFAAPLVIETNAGDKHKFATYLAITPDQRAHGLMFVRSLPDNFGMLFVYENPRIISMWMKNTVLSLDMLFIRADGTIANIARNTEPGSLKSISSTEPVTRVLELNAGTAKKLNIQPGDRVITRKDL